MSGKYKQSREHIDKRMINAKKGWFKKGEKAINWNGFKKGNKSWNKGLARELQPRYGKSHSEETKNKIGLSNRKPNLLLKGHKFNLGRHHTKETKQKLRKINLGVKRPQISKIVSERNRINNPMKDPKTAKKHSETMKIKWKDIFYRDKVIKNTLKGLFKRPTSLEKQMIEIIKRNNLPYKYTGDGSFLIGYKNPDFINTNGKKICIEVANTIHHKEDYEQKRKEHFAKYGWKCIVFRTNNLYENEVIKKIKNIQLCIG